MSAKRKIFDAHHHLWKLDECRYPWLMAKGVKRFFGDPAPIQKDYLLRNFLDDASEYDVVGSTHIQVGVDKDDAVKETQWLQSTANKTGLPNAIVAFADLTSDNIDEILSAHAQSKNFRGIRQIVGRHPSEDAATGTGALLDSPRFLHGLRRLALNGLSFDLQLTAAQYDGAIRLFRQLPDLKIAICHFASPWDRSRDGFENWRRAMRAFADMPHCHMKFSGFGMFEPNWTLDHITPYLDTAITVFGEDRCMAGSNFPVDKLYGDYNRIWRALEKWAPSETVLKKITMTNASDYYAVLPES